MKILEIIKGSVHVVELIIRNLFNAPIVFPMVGPDEGYPVGPVLESQFFPPVSAVRDQSLHLVRGRLTREVLANGLRANAFRDMGIVWRGREQTNLFLAPHVGQVQNSGLETN